MRRLVTTAVRRIIDVGKKPVVAVAMSGGIDSAVSALLLKQEGYQCIGVFMKNWDPLDEAEARTCTTDRDRNDMHEVCRYLDMPTTEVEFIKEYWHDVFVPFLDAYKTGAETPNPDVLCNRAIKFHHFRRHALETLQADIMATGHYARLEAGTGVGAAPSAPSLLRALDPVKDQSYFLSMTPGSSLRDVLFPVGALTKMQVRELAAQHLSGLGVLAKPESMGLCFVGKRDMASFLGGYLTLTPGRFVDVDTGLPVGEHRGKELFTVGQGARIGGCSDRYFVTFRRWGGEGGSREPGDVFVVKGALHPLLFSLSCTLRSRDVSWVAGQAPTQYLASPDSAPHTRRPLLFKARYIQQLESCTATVAPDADGDGDYTVTLHFDAPHRAITAGQVLALYDGQVCLGGGVIR